MFDTIKLYPWWRTTISDIEDILSTLKVGKALTLCHSAGNRPIRYAVYGDKPDFSRHANYSSACGARDIRHFANRAGKPPVVMLIGAVHGQELEGVAALYNLILLLETGVDGMGNHPDFYTKVADCNMRLIIIPILNIDGRVRCRPDSMLDMTDKELRYWGQGTWRDGSLCGWPECKSYHPILERAGFLGAYFNDDGVNLMHDSFFSPYAAETATLLRLAEDEAPDIIIQLHGGSNSTNILLRTDYVSLEANEQLTELAERCAALTRLAGLPTAIDKVKSGKPAPSFNLASALHHSCGALSAVYESNEGLKSANAFAAEDILKLHYLLFESVFSYSIELRSRKY